MEFIYFRYEIDVSNSRNFFSMSQESYLHCPVDTFIALNYSENPNLLRDVIINIYAFDVDRKKRNETKI